MFHKELSAFRKGILGAFISLVLTQSILVFFRN